MLAYVFVHQPADGTGAAEYGARLATFHAALGATPPEGFRSSWVWRVEAGPLGHAFEDWYLVKDWTALGALDAAAVTGSRKPPHDDLASRVAHGVGAVYGLASGQPTSEARCRVRIAKPPGVPYPTFEGSLRQAVGPGAAVWKRQMVLGADLEFLVDAPARPATDTIDGTPMDVSALRPVSRAVPPPLRASPRSA